MEEKNGLLWALDVDGTGRGSTIGWDEIEAGSRSEGFRWIHLDIKNEHAREWIRTRSGLTDLESEALLADETRPRSSPMGEALLLNLRGVNLNPEANPEDLVSARIWTEPNRVITLRGRRIFALGEVRARLEQGRGVQTVGEFVVEVAGRLVDGISDIITDIDERLDAVEEAEEQDIKPSDARASLIRLRRESIAIRRYVSPQRDALARLYSERIPWLGDLDRLHLREVLDRTTRYVEDLEASRERAAVTQEELAQQVAEQLNERMYMLSIVAGVFLPLGFLTGLLGINVGGIPGAETSWAFAAVCAGLAALIGGEAIVFRRLGWI